MQEMAVWKRRTLWKRMVQQGMWVVRGCAKGNGIRQKHNEGKGKACLEDF